MGHAMAGQLLAPGHTVLTLARRPDEALASRAAASARGDASSAGSRSSAA